MRKILSVLPLSVLFVACGMEKSTPAGGNAGATDTGSIDTGSADTGSADTGSTDTGSTDTGSTDTGSTDTFLCDDGSEILVAFRCDGIRTLGAGGADCADGSDERNCPPFVCADGTEIPYELRCNYTGPGGAGGPSDCADGSDEANCEGLYFICQYGVIPYELVCDGMNDCPTETGMPQGESNSDELSCFTCSDGSSIPSSNVCDGGRRDCADGEDEASCSTPEPYICADGTSISASWACDGDLDCVGGGDEIGCGGQFACGELFSIPESNICNGGEPDCPLGEDESNCGSLGSFEP